MLTKLSHKAYPYSNSWFCLSVLEHIAHTHMHTELEICRKGTLDPIHKGCTLQAVSSSMENLQKSSLKPLRVDLQPMLGRGL